jgi:hypothetical protein
MSRNYLLKCNRNHNLIGGYYLTPNATEYTPFVGGNCHKQTSIAKK